MKYVKTLSVVCLMALISTPLLLSSCTSSSESSSNSSSSCDLTDNTTETSTVSSYGCSLLERDTSSCESERTAQGLSGFWLKFSCRVTLTVSGSNVIISTDGQPDYKSSYFETSNSCYEEFDSDERYSNPNTLGEQTIVVTVPMTPTMASSTMSMGAVGIAANGVAIFNNAANPPDNIYDEIDTFDKCEGHPAGTMYHYHSEPTSITSADDNFVGVMRDGIPIYGRLDSDDSTPTLDSDGGHTGATPDSASTYHYHVNLQTSGSDSAYFITSGNYAGAAGSCTGCN